jgi:hypothetical protein
MLEAYRDDAEYTAPEMEPGHGEDIHPPIDEADALVGVAGFSMGMGGGALAGAVLQGIADERGPDASFSNLVT